MNWFLLVSFGFAGIVLRWTLSTHFNSTFPLGTLFANLLGALLIGWFSEQSWVALSQPVKLAVVIGFLGAMTTFSSYTLELFTLLKQEKWLLGLMYFFLSNGLGLFFCFLGWKLAKTA